MLVNWKNRLDPLSMMLINKNECKTIFKVKGAKFGCNRFSEESESAKNEFSLLKNGGVGKKLLFYAYYFGS